MYVSRGPSKIAASTRRGLAKPLDNLENRDTEKHNGDPIIMSSPKPVFNHNQNHLNGKRAGIQRMKSNPQDPPFHQQEELAQFLFDSWSRVQRDMEKDRGMVYKDKNPNPALSNFKPFDLENYWGQRQLEKAGVPNSS